MMDRDSAGAASTELTMPEPTGPHAPGGPVIVSVCITCKTADGGEIVGPEMFAAVQAALGPDDASVVVRPVQCLSVCKRPATVAVSSPDGYTLLFCLLYT